MKPKKSETFSVDSIREIIQGHWPEYLKLLEELVNIQSGTRNVSGVERVQDRVVEQLSHLGFNFEFRKFADFGKHCIARNHEIESPKQKWLAFDVHVDTVFPADSDPNFRIEGERCFGQGVNDMKGGVVVALMALRILSELGALSELPLLFLSVSDEELLSLGSRQLIKELAPEVGFAMVFEEAGKSYEWVSQRKGALEAKLYVRGKAGHAGNVVEDRRNAIEELAYQIVRIRELSQEYLKDGLLFNVGLIDGGISHNSIAEKAECMMSIRYVTAESFAEFKSRVDEITASPSIKGCQVMFELIGEGMPVMGMNSVTREYGNLLEKAVARAGQEITDELRGGGSNACWWAQFGVSVIDGFGPRGGDDHSPLEWMELATVPERCLHVVLFLLELIEQKKFKII